MVNHKFNDLAGRRLGHLTVLSRAGVNRFGRITWLVRCDCGVEKVLPGNAMASGNTSSCGCQWKTLIAASKLKHGLSRRGNGEKRAPPTPEYKSWSGMLTRCGNPGATGYSLYGGRGIRVCERWMVAANFLADMGPKPSPDHSIDRIDSDGHYEPGNCRWATRAEQCRNTRRNRFFTIGDEKLCLADWARRFGIDQRKLTWRIDKKGMAIEAALAAGP